MLAGITASEIGISQTDADKAVDQYFGRNNPNREIKKVWEAHKVDYNKMRKLFAI